jgi:hypothetical protein
MSIQSISRKRVAAAVAVLSVGSAGLTMSGLSDGSVEIRAGTAGKQPEAVVTRASHDLIDNSRVGLVARRVGWGRYTIDRVTDAAMSLSSNASPEAASDETPERKPHVPRTVVIGLPSYEGGRQPSATAPTVDRGTSPSVDPGWTTTIDLGEAPSVGSPSVDPGEMGTVHAPSVEVN